jgi:hypothetical protein
MCFFYKRRINPSIAPGSADFRSGVEVFGSEISEDFMKELIRKICGWNRRLEDARLDK